jgi:hypothetical protein
MFIQSGRDNVVDYAHALIHCVVENVIDNDTLTLLNERAKRDSALHALLNGAFAAFCATNNHTDFRETVAMLGELVRGGGGDEEGDVFANAPAHSSMRTAVVDDARRADEEL